MSEYYRRSTPPFAGVVGRGWRTLVRLVIAAITYWAFLSKRRPSADRIEQLCNSWTSCPGLDRASTDHRVERIADFTVAGSPGMAFEARGDSICLALPCPGLAGAARGLIDTNFRLQLHVGVACEVPRAAGAAIIC